MSLKKEKIFSVIESLLFAHSDPVSLSDLEAVFKNELSKEEIKTYLKELEASYKEEVRGIEIVTLKNSFQLRTKIENKDHLLKSLKTRPFRLSAPALETLAIIAYSQPCTKLHVAEIRGVECSHLLKTLMEKGLIQFAGKSSLPGKPSLYKTTQKFLETFSFESLKDLPSEEEIATLLPQAPQLNKKETLSEITESLSENHLQIPYEEDEKENQKLKDNLNSIPSTINFLEKED